MSCALGNGTAPASLLEDWPGSFFFLSNGFSGFWRKFFKNKRLHNAFEIVVQSRFGRAGLDALWWAGGVLRGGVVDGDGLVDAMGGMVFFVGSVSDADRGIVAWQVGVERESYGFGSRFDLIATRSASSVGFGRSVVEVAL